MKLLTCVIPCYNSAAYVEQAVSSLLPGGEEMDILIVDDGSTDETGAIADRLAARYPGLVRVHHQPNGGHGSALNFGIRDALGTFFKGLDSDDMLDPAYLPGLLDLLRGLAEKDTPDLVI
ncbi:MAG: glycosyltransferase, partial [Clostridia bacterium]|nr:glycosyltransferase [Clostridia bacterium]